MDNQGTELNLRFTDLSDRFRSLWTFYQFLGGVYKHQGRGAVPFDYDFQALYRDVQALVPKVGVGTNADSRTVQEFEKLERILGRIHNELSNVEAEFSPSLLRKFFDHLKNQDEKILYALVKFYMLQPAPARDTFDKLDILLTRLAGSSSDGGPERLRDRRELERSFERLAEMAAIPAPTSGEERTLIGLIRDLRNEVRAIPDFQGLLHSRLIDRFRELKERLGKVGLYPSLLIEIVETNIELKNRFLALYLEEEAKILEDTNKVFEIERYIERNPGVAHEDLTRQLEIFRMSRERFDAKRRDNNVKREDIVALRDSMQTVLESFEPQRGVAPAQSEAIVEEPLTTTQDRVDDLPEDVEGFRPQVSETPPEVFPEPDQIIEQPVSPERPSVAAPEGVVSGSGPFGPPQAPEDQIEEIDDIAPTDDEPSLIDLLPPDPLLMTALHKILFALELVTWEHGIENVGGANELHHLKLEPWEVGTYRKMLEMRSQVGTLPWELQAFFLTSAALRVKMEEELSEIGRLRDAGHADKVLEVLEHSAQSLERAREVDRRFRWFIDDMLFQGQTELLEQVYRSHFRFLNIFSSLWLEHQSSGGVAPL
ncbi:MAG: hypothetical protein DRJ65_11930 [Acidobacteria bacterium]|nr:MAG: hypothetical protein DRJ65_11930 [Acidobacteriota bacterium]